MAWVVAVVGLCPVGCKNLNAISQTQSQCKLVEILSCIWLLSECSMVHRETRPVSKHPRCDSDGKVICTFRCLPHYEAGRGSGGGLASASSWLLQTLGLSAGLKRWEQRVEVKGGCLFWPATCCAAQLAVWLTQQAFPILQVERVWKFQVVQECF